MTHSGATASLAIPVVVAVAVAGWALAFPLKGLRMDGWAISAWVAVFAAYAAPVVLSGQATFPPASSRSTTPPPSTS